MSFWENIGNNNKTNNQGFNIGEFMKFYNSSIGKDPNAMLQELSNSGKYSQEQIQNATNQAQNILKTLQTMGIKF